MAKSRWVCPSACLGEHLLPQSAPSGSDERRRVEALRVECQRALCPAQDGIPRQAGERLLCLHEEALHVALNPLARHQPSRSTRESTRHLTPKPQAPD